MSHTPGPWTAYLDEEAPGVENSEIRAQGSLIACVYGTEDFPCLTDEPTEILAEELAGNAMLIAAAPALLAALKAALPYVEKAYECAFPNESENFLVREDIMAAIAKAETAEAK